MRRWAREVLGALDEAGRPMDLPTIGDMKAMLAAAGFVDIWQQTIPVPYNPWPGDPTLREIGRWFNLGFCQGLSALSLGPLTRVKGWTPDQVGKLVDQVKTEVCTRRYHGFCEM